MYTTPGMLIWEPSLGMVEVLHPRPVPRGSGTYDKQERWSSEWELYVSRMRSFTDSLLQLDSLYNNFLRIYGRESHGVQNQWSKSQYCANLDLSHCYQNNIPFALDEVSNYSSWLYLSIDVSYNTCMYNKYYWCPMAEQCKHTVCGSLGTSLSTTGTPTSINYGKSVYTIPMYNWP